MFQTDTAFELKICAICTAFFMVISFRLDLPYDAVLEKHQIKKINRFNNFNFNWNKKIGKLTFFA